MMVSERCKSECPSIAKAHSGCQVLASTICSGPAGGEMQATGVVAVTGRHCSDCRALSHCPYRSRVAGALPLGGLLVAVAAPDVEAASCKSICGQGRGVCKRAAIKAGQVLSVAEQRQLILDLERSVSPRTCPHGRPTMVHLSVAALERQFGRRG